jgi:Na+/H+ antiporter NhaC
LPLVTEKTKLCLDTNKVYKTLEKKHSNNLLTNNLKKSKIMATTKQAAPKKKSEGFQGVRGAFWIIVVCAIIAFTLFFTWFGNDMHFQDPGVQDHPADIWGTIYKGGVIVPVIHTLLLTVLAMTIERWMALRFFLRGCLFCSCHNFTFF